jgi:hypothetical protein
MVINMKHGYVYESLLTDKLSKDAKKLVGDYTKKLHDKGFKSIESVAQDEVDYALEFIQRRGIRAGEKLPNLKSKMEYVRHVAADLLVFATSAKSVYHIAMLRLNKGKGFWYYNPYAEKHLVNVSDMEAWTDLLASEKAKAQRWYNNMEYEANNACIKYEQIAILNTPTPWLGDGYRLHTLSQQFPTFEAFLVYCQGIIDELESMPNTDWDYDMTTSLVMRPKNDTAHGIINSGIDKGKRTFFMQEHDTEGYWYNYDVLPVDILKKFLHLTFLQSISYKPLVRLESDGVDYGTRHYFEFDEDEDMEQGLITTPLYADPYFHEDEQF